MPLLVEGTPAVSNSGTVAVNSYNVAMPAGIVAGERLIWACYTNLATLPSTPSGWTVLYSQTGTAQSWVIFTKIADGTETTTALTIVNTRSVSAVFRLSGVNTTPLDVAASGTAGTTALTFPAVTPITAGAVIFAFGGVITASGVVNTSFVTNNLDQMLVNGGASGMHTTNPPSANTAAGIGREAWVSGAFTPNMTQSTSTTARTMGVRIALRPAPEPVASEFEGWGVPI